MIRPINFPKYRFLEALRKSIGNSRFNLMNNQFYTLECGDKLIIHNTNESSFVCNFISYTNTGEIAVSFQGKGLAIISPVIIKNILSVRWNAHVKYKNKVVLIF